MGWIVEMLDSMAQSMIVQRGFEDGIEGRAPATTFRGRNRSLYFGAYRRGQRAAKVRLQNAITKRLQQTNYEPRLGRREFKQIKGR